MTAMGMAVVGAGYWGPQLVRNARALPDTDLKWVCDRDLARARHVVGEQSEIRITPELGDVLADESVEAVAIATPPRTHAELALRCIEAGRHVLVEKPLADSLAAGMQIVRAAEEYGVALHCDHTFCYTPAVQKIRDMVAGGELGTPLYYDSVRVNLGLVQHEVDVFWDLARTTSRSWTSSSAMAANSYRSRRRERTRWESVTRASATCRWRLTTGCWLTAT